MKPAHLRGAVELVAALCLLSCGALLSAQTPPAPASPQTAPPLPWIEAEYRTSKLILLATTRATAALVPSATAAAALRTAPVGTSLPLPPGDVARLDVESSLPFGRHETMQVFFDPTTGAAFGTDKLTTGRRARHTILRYLRDGIYTWSRSPADKREESLTPELWTDLHEGFSPYPAELPADGVVVDAHALLVLTAMPPLASRSPAGPLYVMSYHGFLALDFTTDGVETRRVEIEEQRPSGTRTRAGRKALRVLRATARAVPANPAATPHDLAVLGLQGGVTMFLDPETGILTALKGRADYVGTLTSQLVRMRLADDIPSKARPAADHEVAGGYFR